VGPLRSRSIPVNSIPEPTRYRVVVLTSWDRTNRISAGLLLPQIVITLQLAKFLASLRGTLLSLKRDMRVVGA
jgi:hypothetical protein